MQEAFTSKNSVFKEFNLQIVKTTVNLG